MRRARWVDLAGAIAYALEQKSMLVLNVEFYTGIGTTLLDPRLVDLGSG